MTSMLSKMRRRVFVLLIKVSPLAVLDTLDVLVFTVRRIFQLEREERYPVARSNRRPRPKKTECPQVGRSRGRLQCRRGSDSRPESRSATSPDQGPIGAKTAWIVVLSWVNENGLGKNASAPAWTAADRSRAITIALTTMVGMPY